MSTKHNLSLLALMGAVMLGGCMSEQSYDRPGKVERSPDMATIVCIRGQGVRGGPAVVTVDREAEKARPKVVQVKPGFRQIGVAVNWSNRFSQSYELSFVAHAGRVYEVIALEAGMNETPTLMERVTEAPGLKQGKEVLATTAHIFSPEKSRPGEHECFLWVREQSSLRKLAGVAPAHQSAWYRPERPKAAAVAPAQPPARQEAEEPADTAAADGSGDQQPAGEAGEGAVEQDAPVEAVPPAGGEKLQVEAGEDHGKSGRDVG